MWYNTWWTARPPPPRRAAQAIMMTRNIFVVKRSFLTIKGDLFLKQGHLITINGTVGQCASRRPAARPTLTLRPFVFYTKIPQTKIL